MDKTEWVTRYAARMVKAGIAEDVAKAIAEEADYDEDTEPEFAADDELSYWMSDS